jgi:hypothetical protein
MLKIKSEIKQNVDKDVQNNFEKYSNMDRDIKEEIRAYIDSNDLWLTPEAIKKVNTQTQDVLSANKTVVTSK